MVIGRVIINPDDYSLEVIVVCREKGHFPSWKLGQRYQKFVVNLMSEA